jgi:nicotinamidase-related amidase
MAREPHRSSEILDAVALLVVDMQDAFLNVMPDREVVLRRTALAIESARAFGIKVIFTEQVPEKLGPTHAALRSLAPEARVFAKAEFSALLAEGLHEYLRRINVYHLLLAGIETPICVYQTALHAQDNELDVTILSDCTTGRRPEDCYVVLESLARAECHVLPAETVFYSMLGSSLNPRFAHFTRIVKRYSAEAPIDGTPTPAPEPESRPASEERTGGGRHGDRHDRHHGGRHDERRHEQRHEAARTDESSPEDADATDDLRAEDGISADEADQPSYEEATAEHSEVDEASAHAAEPARAPARDEQSDEDADSDDEVPASDDEGTEGETSTASADGAPKRKRGRRRRGGARRRRARERAAAAGGDPGQPAAERGAAPAGDSTRSDSGAPGEAPQGSPPAG